MRYLVTGAGGMLGTDLIAALDGRDVAAMTRAELDITDLAAVRAAVRDRDVILNTAAYTAVDEAESHEDDAYAVNAGGAANLATAAHEVGATLVHYSTDYVFDGTATSPYAEDAPTSPVTAYGRSKAAGEELAVKANLDRTYLLRTAYLYGQHGPNFAATMLRLAADRDTVSVVTDQVGQPTWSRDLAIQTVKLLDREAAFGIYHGTNSGSASWFDFARAIFQASGLDPERVLPTTSDQFVRPAPRPGYSVLGHDRWSRSNMSPMRDWREALDEAITTGALTKP